MPDVETPAIVLVHGAFADAAGWAPITELPLGQGFRVFAPPVYNPLSAAAFTEPAAVAAWKTKPAWGIVSSADRTINPDVERFGYMRAGLRRVVEIDAPHLVMRSHPAEVAAVITAAAAELS
ncbi:alpha/beta fold hydrolase [Nocardia sp. NPDC127526]|uniref:alpha/beta fold hydrolase n=1 Tax=Nocardia sp. NPDC127526 TaxID=3345393 RepID=UPI00362C0141